MPWGMEAEEKADRCRYFEGLFSPYIAGELDGPERRALAQHLHECEHCAEAFRLSWQAATGIKGDRRSRAPSPRRFGLPGRGALWLLIFACAGGVALLGALGLLRGDGGGRADIFPRSKLPLVDEALARMVRVQTELLAAIVEPLRGTKTRVSHAARGEALDFFERLAAARRAAAGGRGALGTPAARAARLDPFFHRLFRAVDPRPGGRSWSRAEWFAEILRGGLPEVTLVSVDHASPRHLLCTIVWGGRPAFAFLVREARQTKPGAAAGTGLAEGPFALAYLLFSSP